eukprot:SAG22_NODE_18_length_32591_cov_38.043549_16_plen_125_part_00
MAGQQIRVTKDSTKLEVDCNVEAPTEASPGWINTNARGTDRNTTRNPIPQCSVHVSAVPPLQCDAHLKRGLKRHGIDESDTSALFSFLFTYPPVAAFLDNIDAHALPLVDKLFFRENGADIFET